MNQSVSEARARGTQAKVHDLWETYSLLVSFIFLVKKKKKATKPPQTTKTHKPLGTEYKRRKKEEEEDTQGK